MLTQNFLHMVQRWAASGGGGLFFSGNDIPSWFTAVVNEDEIVYIDVPYSDIGALTLCIIYSSDDSQSSGRLSLTVTNRTQRTVFSIFPMTVSGVTPHEDYLWLGRIPNNGRRIFKRRQRESLYMKAIRQSGSLNHIHILLLMMTRGQANTRITPYGKRYGCSRNLKIGFWHRARADWKSGTGQEPIGKVAQCERDPGPHKEGKKTYRREGVNILFKFTP